MKIFFKNSAINSIPLLLLILLINTLTGSIFAQAKSSKITFIETKHDFGSVQKGILLEYEYKFKNDGGDTLIINNVRASCGCTGASIGDKKKFANNEEGEIKVTFNTSGRSGIQSKTVSVQSNDPENPNVILSFTCEIVSK
jgi:Protein of unknown function (DUF1573)